MAARIRISAKALGEVALPGFCERCFWIKLHAGNKLPFQIFPGIFSSIDSYSKNLVHGWFDKYRSAPSWLAPLGDVTDYVYPPHYSKFKIIDEEHDVLLSGSPDGVFVRSDGSHLIVDYKTSRFTKNQDSLYPMYETQLNAYARIGEQCGLSPVSGLALIYTEPVTDALSALEQENHRDGGFAMGFTAYIREVPLDTTMLGPLLARARQVYELPCCPAASPACKDCQNLDSLVHLMTI